ncbi:helix-turn-helix domain-containing protein [Streptomyces sp. NPDC001663]|uniref:winged helix-turn-helix domain-containing protein n=1 Tax=Streptomyces sp. NPDC001663 TaxID=3364597 RepID=UPI0036971517
MRGHCLPLHAPRRGSPAPPQGVRPARRLAQHGGEAVSREALIAEAWDENWFGSAKTLDVAMAG